MKDEVPGDVVEHVREFMNYVCFEDKMDKPWWTRNSTGRFSAKSAWDLLRHRKEKDENMKAIWVKGLPFKTCFLIWRVWKGMILVAALLNS